MTTPSSPKVLHRRLFGKKRGFTLLELVVALVVLGILAALAIPTYLTVINNAKVATANSIALSVTDDAIAIAAFHNTYPTEPDYVTAVSETKGVSLTSYLDPPTYSTVCYTITTASVSEDVCVTVPNVVNAAPSILSDAAHDSSTTTTTTTPTSTTTSTTTTTTTTLPADVPSAPTDVEVSPGGTSLTVSWSPPSSDGGSPVTGYTVSYSSDGGSTWSTPTAATSPDTITGLTGDTPYSVKVVAVNANGSGAESPHISGTTATVITTAADNAIAISPDGAYAYATDGSKLYKIDLGTNAVVATLTTGFNGDFIIINPAGTKAYIADSGGYAIGNEVGVVDLSTFTMDTPITTSAYDPAGLAINAAGNRLYILENWPTATVTVIDLSDNSTVATITDPGGISFLRGIGIDPAAGYLYVENGGDIAAIDLSTNTVATPGAYSSSDTIDYVALRGLSESAGPDVLLMVDEDTGGYSTAASPSPDMTDLVVSPTGGYAYGVEGNNYYEIDLYPLSTTEIGSASGSYPAVAALAVNPAGTKIYVVETSGGVLEVPVP